ncbi:MAG TPA: hypothetical protein VN605_06705 [Thermoanaerobaculia bacterium]|nr:hypothetical protein [Thermoanaerobaculia bacterium]
MTPQRLDAINYANAGLMIASCVAAFLLPFELFLFVYAVLGPLHYLTQISWLHDRDYFVPRARKPWLMLVGLTTAVLVVAYLSDVWFHDRIDAAYEVGLVWLVFLTAAMLFLVRQRASAIALVVVTLFAIAIASAMPIYIIAAYLLVTIVHVFLFTALFVLFGALKSRSRSAYISLAVYAACTISFFVIHPSIAPAAEAIRRNYSFFEPLNMQLMSLFGFAPADLYASRGGVAVMRLIAFAYTYHYLNWFSKTSIIRWHEVSKRRAIAIAALWAASVGIYAYDYALGIGVLYILSMLHVLLEFPLDHQTFAGIGRALMRRGDRSGSSSQPGPRAPLPATARAIRSS